MTEPTIGVRLERDTTTAPTVRTDDEGRRVYTALAYDTTSVDRHGTTMTPDALKVVDGDVPVLLFHNGSSFPVGKVTGFRQTANGPEADFVLHSETDDARTAGRLIDLGFLRGVSVGFIGKAGDVRPDGVFVYTDAELVELSLTPVPSSRLAQIQRDIADLMEHLPADETPESTDEAHRCVGLCPCGVEIGTEDEDEPVEETREVASDEAAATENVETDSRTAARLAALDRLAR